MALLYKNVCKNCIVEDIEKNIVLDCERMKYPHTGLYHFCKNLGNALLRELADYEKLTIFANKTVKGSFGDRANYLTQNSWHKMMLPCLHKYNLWHATHQGTQYYPYKNNIPVILTIHDLNFLKDSDKSLKKKQSYISELQKKVDRADHIVTISNYTSDELKQHINLGNKTPTVIYNGCNIDEYSVLILPGIIPSSPFLFTIGTITDKKNFHVLPRLLVGNDYTLVIAGITHNISYRQLIIQEAARYGVSDRLIFTGPVTEEEKNWYYSNCLLFLFPSLAEGFGLPVIEAMYFGKTVLLSKEGSLPEIAGSYAYYFDSFDAVDMQKTLTKALNDAFFAEKAAFISNHAKQYSWSKAARSYLELYRNSY